MRVLVVVVVVMVHRELCGLGSLASVDLAQQMLLPFLEKLVGELPPVRHDLPETLR